MQITDSRKKIKKTDSRKKIKKSSHLLKFYSRILSMISRTGSDLQSYEIFHFTRLHRKVENLRIRIS